MTTEELLIHELAVRAGISVRTIRYYIEEGLLPQPNYQGKYSYFTPNYLDRLELIRRLKESYLPLREIRGIMSALTDDEVHEKLKASSLPTPKFIPEPKPTQPASKPGAKALDYIDRLMEDQTRYRIKGTVNRNQPAPIRTTESVSQPNLTPPDRSSNLTIKEVWQRLSLAPGVELHLRSPLDPATESQVQQLINFSKKIFHNKS